MENRVVIVTKTLSGIQLCRPVKSRLSLNAALTKTAIKWLLADRMSLVFLSASLVVASLPAQLILCALLLITKAVASA